MLDQRNTKKEKKILIKPKKKKNVAKGNDHLQGDAIVQLDDANEADDDLDNFCAKCNRSYYEKMDSVYSVK